MQGLRIKKPRMPQLFRDEKCADLGGGGVLMKHQAHGSLSFGARKILASGGSASDFTEERSEFVTHGFGRKGIESCRSAERQIYNRLTRSGIFELSWRFSNLIGNSVT